MKRRLAGILCSFLIFTALVPNSFGEDLAEGDSEVTTPSPKKKGGFFKKVGRFAASNVLGVDLPEGKENEPTSTPTDQESAQGPRPKSQRTPAQDEAEQKYAIWMLTWAAAQESLKAGQIDRLELPTNKSDQAAFDAACLKGPNSFYEKLYAGDSKALSEMRNGPPMTDWKPILPLQINDPLLWCHSVTETLKDAKQIHALARSQGVEAAEVKSQNIEWARWDELARAGQSTLRPNVRFPRNDKEQAELNAAARKGQQACYAWFDPKHPQPDWGNARFPSEGMRTPVQQCNDLVRIAKYND